MKPERHAMQLQKREIEDVSKSRYDADDTFVEVGKTS